MMLLVACRLKNVMLQLCDIWCKISLGYVSYFVLNYTFHFCRMHEHVSVSHEKDFTGLTDLMNYRFYSAKVDSNVKNQVLAVLYKQKKPLLLQV